MNSATMSGVMPRDPKELKFTKDGKAVSSFSIGVRGRTKDDTTWVRVVAFGKQAELCDKFLKKGSYPTVCGRVQINQYETKSGEHRAELELVANSVDFGPFTDGEKSAPKAKAASKDDDFYDDELP